MTHCKNCGRFVTAKARMTRRLMLEAKWRGIWRNVGKDAR